MAPTRKEIRRKVEIKYPRRSKKTANRKRAPNVKARLFQPPGLNQGGAFLSPFPLMDCPRRIREKIPRNMERRRGKNPVCGDKRLPISSLLVSIEVPIARASRVKLLTKSLFCIKSLIRPYFTGE
jgi:hypothetical protein